LTHDLKLTPKDQESESILLFDSSLFKRETTQPSKEKSIEDLMSCMLSEDNNPHFKKHLLTTGDREFEGTLKVTPLFEYVGTFFKGLVYELTNTTNKVLHLQERNLALHEDAAIAVGLEELYPNQSTRIYILKEINKRGGE